MHQGAQTDRACIAYNYYSESMNFFKPRVSEKRAHDGICGLEFPVVNYTAACLYKLFGFHDFWYRLLMFFISSTGILFAVKLFYRQKINPGLALPLLFLWMASPVFLFYSISYLPDMAAMSFCVLAVYFLWQYLNDHSNKKKLYTATLFIALSGLIKITYLVYPMAFITAAILAAIIHKKNLRNYSGYFAGLLVALVPVAIWYYYSKKLTAFTGNTHFLQSINPPESIGEFFKNLSYTLQTWSFQLFPPNVFYILILIFILSALFVIKKHVFHALFFLISLFGIVAILLLFSRQFLYHDYYLIILYPLLLQGFILLGLTLQQLSTNFKPLILVFPLILLGMMVFHFFHANKNTIGRFEKGNYLNQVVFDGVENYTKYSKEIGQIIPANAMVFSAFDPQPNATLYLLKRKGVRIFTDFDTTITNDIISKIPCDYFVINNLELWNQKYVPALKVKITPVWNKEGIWVFKKE